MAGGFYEAGLWTDAVLFWDRNDASLVYSGNPLDFDFYYWMSGVGVSFVLLLITKYVRIRQNAGKGPGAFCRIFLKNKLFCIKMKGLQNKPPAISLSCVRRIHVHKIKEMMSGLFCNTLIHFHYALSTKPERRQEVHTYIFLAAPLTLTLTDFTFAFQIALDLLWEWLTLLPK